MYEMHVSKQFLLTTTFASALYLCVLRYLSNDFIQCFTVADAISVAGNYRFSVEESQIFRLFALVPHDGVHPNANACLCKVALATHETDAEFPCDLVECASRYVETLTQLSTRCRLAEEQELRLLELADPSDESSAKSTTDAALSMQYARMRNRRLQLEARLAGPGEQTLPRKSSAVPETAPMDVECYSFGLSARELDVGQSWYTSCGAPTVLEVPPEAYEDLHVAQLMEPVRAPLFLNGDEVKLDGPYVEHLRSNVRVVRWDPLMRRGDTIKLVGRRVEHVRSGRSFPRKDAEKGVFRKGDVVILEGRRVIHEATGIETTRFDSGTGKGQKITLKTIYGYPNEIIYCLRDAEPPIDCRFHNIRDESSEGVLLTLKKNVSEEVGEVINLISHCERNDGGPPIRGEFTSPPSALFLNDDIVELRSNTVILKDGPSLRLRGVAHRTVVRTDDAKGVGQLVTLSGLKERPGELIDLEYNGDPATSCKFHNVTGEADGRGETFVLERMLVRVDEPILLRKHAHPTSKLTNSGLKQPIACMFKNRARTIIENNDKLRVEGYTVVHEASGLIIDQIDENKMLVNDGDSVKVNDLTVETQPSSGEIKKILPRAEYVAVVWTRIARLT